MRILFTAEQFDGVFRACNVAVWSVQWILVLPGLTVIAIRVWPDLGLTSVVSVAIGWTAFVRTPATRDSAGMITQTCEWVA